MIVTASKVNIDAIGIREHASIGVLAEMLKKIVEITTNDKNIS